MSFETDIILKYASSLGGRMYWDTTPVNWIANDMAAPFAIVQTVGGKSLAYIDKGLHEFLNQRVQFSIWGANRIAVSNAARSLAAAVNLSNTATWITMPEGEQGGDFNEVLKLRGSRQDFGFWFLNPHYVE